MGYISSISIYFRKAAQYDCGRMREECACVASSAGASPAELVLGEGLLRKVSGKGPLWGPRLSLKEPSSRWQCLVEGVHIGRNYSYFHSIE